MLSISGEHIIWDGKGVSTETRQFSKINSISKGNLIKGLFPIWLFEWKDYILEITTEESAEQCLEKITINKISQKDNRNVRFLYDNGSVLLFIFRFENQIGKSSLEYKGTKLEFEVVSEKLINNKSDLFYPFFFENLRSVLYKKLTRLPYEIIAETYSGARSGFEASDDFFRGIFFLSKTKRKEIISALSTILNSPHYSIDSRREFVPFEEVDSIDGESLYSIVEHPEYLTKVKTPIDKSLKKFAPEKILSEEYYLTVDNTENRFVKFFVNIMFSDYPRVLEYFNKKPTKLDFKLLGELENYMRSTLYIDSSTSNSFTFESSVLRKKSGYADLFHLYQEYLFSYSPFIYDLKIAIDNRNVAQMYEYFCFFELAEKLASNYRESSFFASVSGDSLMEGKSMAKFSIGPESSKSEGLLVFNKTFSSSSKTSYSVNLRPDFSLYINGKLEGVFDAKFRMDISEFADEIGISSTAKKPDLYKMHTYRDAIIDAKFAVVCYPGVDQKFHKTTGKKLGNRFQLISEITNLKIPEGIGCISFKPTSE